MGDEYNWGDFDLQSQLDENLGSDYNADLTDPSQQGIDYLQNQNDWDFGNYQDQWANLTTPNEGGQGGGLGDLFSNLSMDNGWGEQSFAPGSAMANVMTQSSPNTSFPQLQGNTDSDLFGGGLSGLSNILGGLFNGQSGITGKQLGTMGAALLEGRQNKRMASQIPQAVQQQQQRTSPFDVASSGASSMGANSMRDAMQQKLAAAMTDPYGQPIVKSQVDQIARTQAIKDAAAGRRSNTATSSPAMMAEQAKVAQNYINSLQQPAGANINPSSQGLEQIMQALKYGTQGTASPMMSALGYGTGSNQTSNAMQQIVEMMSKLKGAA